MKISYIKRIIKNFCSVTYATVAYVTHFHTQYHQESAGPKKKFYGPKFYIDI